MEQYILKSAIMEEIKRYKHKADERLKIKGRTLSEDCKDSALQNLCGNLLHFIDTLEVKEVDISNISENLAEAYEYLDYTSTGNLAHNKPMVSARLKKAIQGLFDAGLFELTHDKKYRMEDLGLKAQKGE